MNSPMQQMQMQQIQNMMNQLSSLYSQVSTPSADPLPAFSPAAQPALAQPARTVQYVHGLDGARDEQQKLKPGESAIVMDDAESIFYAIMKDKEGKVPRKLKVGRFTMEDEPDPPKYITQSDLDNFKTELLDAIKGGNK